MLHDLHSPEAWRRVVSQINAWSKLVTSTSRGRSVLCARGGRVESVRDSEALTADLDFENIIDSTICGLLKSGIQSVIDTCYDGGKTTILTIAMIFEWLAPLYYSRPLNRSVDGLVADELMKRGLDAFNAPKAATQAHVLDYVERELQDIPADIMQLLSQYLDKAGEYTQLHITATSREIEPFLRELPWYYVEVARISEEFRPATTMSTGLILLIDGHFGKAEDFQPAFSLAQERDVPCMVICRSAGPLVRPTLAGNIKNGKRWMVYEVRDFHVFEDLAALLNAPVHYQVPTITAEVDFGKFASAELGPRNDLLITAGLLPSDRRMDHIDRISKSEMTPALRKRLAMLSGDLWELHLGWRLTDSEAYYVSRRIHYVMRAARNFRNGSTCQYSSDIRSAVDAIADPRLSTIFRSLFNAEDYCGSFPAGVSSQIWKSAFTTVRLLLSSKMLLTT